MGRLIMALVVLALIGFAGLAAYAYLADLSPAQAEVKVPVTLNAD
mgnify:CR=1 FL=1